MTTKAITFLGAGPLKETTYRWHDQTCTTHLMAEATARMFGPTQLHVIVTKEARERHFADLVQRLDGVLPVVPVAIPSGQSEDDLWTIFAAIAGVIEDDDTIIFDITNAFRSLPVLALLAAAFVRVVRNATVERIVYGAFEAQQDGITPIFDLTPFVDLFAWTTATDAFIKYGRADDLTPLVRAAASGGTARTRLSGAADLLALADRLGTLTKALQSARPAEVMQTADGLGALVDRVRPGASAAASPFALLLDMIVAEYGSFGLANPEQSGAYDLLSRQLAMIDWYLKKGLAVQAITTAREWLVSLVVAEDGGDIFAPTDREEAERLLNNKPSATIPASHIPRLAELRKVWSSTSRPRNDVAHTGMRRGARRAHVLLEAVTRVCEQLPGLLR